MLIDISLHCKSQSNEAIGTVPNPFTAGCSGQFTEILQDTTAISLCGENRG